MNFTERQPFYPGEILLEEFLQPLHLTTIELAHLINVEAQHVYDIIHHQAAITPDTAIRLSKVFGTSAEIWLNLQMKWDLWHVWHDVAKTCEYANIQPLASVCQKTIQSHIYS